jgi:spore coat polysaccharide biosynthesis predicted glycosyltransferase SpsG
MRFVIRADARRITGAGHVTRCIAVAEELIDRGFEVCFVGDTSDLRWITDLVCTTGFSEIFHQEREFYSDPDFDILILDSYTLNPKANFLLQDKWLKIVALKDPYTLNYKTDLDVHVTIRDFVPQKKDKTNEIGGPQYFPIRSALKVERALPTKVTPPRIIITSGGSEIEGVISVITRSLALIEIDYAAVVLSNQPLEIVDSRFTRVEIGENFQHLLRDASVVFTSAGVTSIEIAANKIPMGVYCAVPNQIENYETLTRRGVAYSLGRFDSNFGEISPEKILTVLESEDRVHSGHFLLDFDGARRIVDSILNLIPSPKAK